MNGRAVLALLSIAACTEPPETVVTGLAAAIAAGNLDRVRSVIDPDYADPLGDRARLLSDLAGIFEAFPRRVIRFTDLSTAGGPSARIATVTGRVDLELVGPPTWRVTGPAQLELVRTTGFRVRSGLLSHLRDIRGLARRRRAALEGNDPEALRDVLHPHYRDGDLDADEAVTRLRQDLDGVSVRFDPTNYRLELRGPTAHLDEHYVLTVGERVLPPAIGRLTLNRSAGRWRILAGLYPPEP